MNKYPRRIKLIEFGVLSLLINIQCQRLNLDTWIFEMNSRHSNIHKTIQTLRYSRWIPVTRMSETKSRYSNIKQWNLDTTIFEMNQTLEYSQENPNTTIFEMNSRYTDIRDEFQIYRYSRWIQIYRYSRWNQDIQISAMKTKYSNIRKNIQIHQISGIKPDTRIFETKSRHRNIRDKIQTLEYSQENPDIKTLRHSQDNPNTLIFAMIFRYSNVSN